MFFYVISSSNRTMIAQVGYISVKSITLNRKTTSLQFSYCNQLPTNLAVQTLFAYDRQLGTKYLF